MLFVNQAVSAMMEGSRIDLKTHTERHNVNNIDKDKLVYSSTIVERNKDGLDSNRCKVYLEKNTSLREK